jgi:hypothetical protein
MLGFFIACSKMLYLLAGCAQLLNLFGNRITLKKTCQTKSPLALRWCFPGIRLVNNYKNWWNPLTLF